MLCSPTEPKKLRALGTTSSIPENHGADFLIVAQKRRIGVQRKQFPGDLLASLNDTRLYNQIPYLQELDHAVVIIEGQGKWTQDGELIADKYHRFTMQQMHGLMFSIMFEYGIPVMWVKDMDATAEVLVRLEAWANKSKHMALRSRSGPGKDSYGQSSQRHLAQHVVQGFSGVGPGLAGRIIDKFNGVPLDWTISKDEMMTVDGLGQKKADNLWKTLEAISSGET